MPKVDCQRGFTLIELLTNIMILGILAMIAFSAYQSYKDKANNALATSDLRELLMAVELLATDTAKWPGGAVPGATGTTQIWDLNSPGAGLVKTDGSFANWKGPYIKSIRKDPWGADYFFDAGYYIGANQYAVVGSFGLNGCCKGAHDADNVILKLN